VLGRPQADELNRGSIKVNVAFTLPPGAYATLVVKRLFHFSWREDTPDEIRAAQRPRLTEALQQESAAASARRPSGFSERGAPAGREREAPAGRTRGTSERAFGGRSRMAERPLPAREPAPAQPAPEPREPSPGFRERQRQKKEAKVRARAEMADKSPKSQKKK
jgi:tRNA pseudouridine13 synthase